MKYIFQAYDQELIPIDALASLIISDDDNIVKIFLSFLTQGIQSGEVKPRGKLGFPVNFPETTGRVKTAILDKVDEKNPLHALRDGNIYPSRPINPGDVDKFFKANMPEFLSQGFLTKTDISGWLGSKGFECQFGDGDSSEGSNLRETLKDFLTGKDNDTTPKDDFIRRKRSALVHEVAEIWPDIEQDLNNASRGKQGLSKVAKLPEHGYWDLTKALNWAVENDKIKKPKAMQFINNNSDSALSPMLRHLFGL